MINDLHMNGGMGLNGISVTGAGRVLIENSEIFGFAGHGIAFSPSAGASLEVTDSIIHDNAKDGLLVTPPSSGSDSVTLENSTFDGNGCGVAVGSTTFGATCAPASGADGGPVAVEASGVTLSQNAGTGLLVSGTNAQASIAGTAVTANARGLSSQNGGAIVEVGVGNAVFGNGTDGAPTSTEAAQVLSAPQDPSGSQGLPVLPASRVPLVRPVQPVLRDQPGRSSS